MAIYLDNAATSFPKPETVYQAMDHYMRKVGTNAGRGSYRRALQADQMLFETRLRLAQLFNAGDASRIVFTANATEAINLAIKGYVSPGDHVIASGMEHNASWRTLRTLEARGIISLSLLPHEVNGTVDLDRAKDLFTPCTRLVVSSHVSNVTGGILPISELGRICRSRGVVFLVDSAQSAGILPIDVEAMGISLLAFTGHKGLLGPQGTGGLYISEDIELRPLKEEGTGSESAREFQPNSLPDRYEAGTLNVPGLIGLGAALEYIVQEGLESIAARERELLNYARHQLAQIPGIMLYGPADPGEQIGVLSFRFPRISPEEIAGRLDGDYGIMVRAGLHCAPQAHRTIGTIDTGTVRIGLGHFNTEDDVDQLLRGLEAIAKS